MNGDPKSLGQGSWAEKAAEEGGDTVCTRFRASPLALQGGLPLPFLPCFHTQPLTEKLFVKPVFPEV